MKPTHFLSLRCRAAEATVGQLQQALVQQDARLEPFCSAAPVRRAHVSLLMLDLSQAGMLEAAIAAFQALAGPGGAVGGPGSALDGLSLPQPLQLQLRGLGTFASSDSPGTRVLFLNLPDCAATTAVYALQDAIRLHFQALLPGAVPDGPAFHAHLTVAKVGNKKAGGGRGGRGGPPAQEHALELIPSAAYAHLLDAAVPGPVEVAELHLCSMAWPTPEQRQANAQEYYRIVAALPFMVPVGAMS